MSEITGIFIKAMLAVPLLWMLVMFATCESMCNSVGYTLGTSVVGPNYPGDDADHADEIVWRCAGFRRKSSGRWGYSGQYDHAACRDLRDRCNRNPSTWMCNQWESIQEGKVGWGNDNITGKNWISPTAKIVSVETLTGEPKKSKKKTRRRRRRKRAPKSVSKQEAKTNKPWHPPYTNPNPPPHNPLITLLELAMVNNDKEAQAAAYTLATNSIISSAEKGLTDKVLIDSAELLRVLKRNAMPFNGKQQSIRDIEQAIERLKKRIKRG